MRAMQPRLLDMPGLRVAAITAVHRELPAREFTCSPSITSHHQGSYDLIESSMSMTIQYVCIFLQQHHTVPDSLACPLLSDSLQR